MFEIGWTEMLVIAVVMIVVVGPKDLPGMLRTFGKTTTKLRSMAGDFQKQFNEALKEAELDDVKKSVDSLRSLNPDRRNQETAQSVRKGRRRRPLRARRGDEAHAQAGRSGEPGHACRRAAEERRHRDARRFDAGRRASRLRVPVDGGPGRRNFRAGRACQRRG